MSNGQDSDPTASPAAGGPPRGLAASQRRWDALKALTAQTILVRRPDGGVFADQPDWEDLTGELDYEGFGWLRSVHPDDVDRVAQRWQQVACLPVPFQDEYRLTLRAGLPRWFSVRSAPVHDETGDIVEWISVYLDVTDRRAAAADAFQVMQELNDLKSAIDEHAIVAITDPRGRITYVNDKFCAISKYERHELLGQDHRLINSGYHPREFFRGLWRTISEGRVWKGEIKNKAKDGSYYWVDTTIVPYLGEDAQPVQYIAIRADITDRKRAAEQMAVALRELNDVKSALDEHAIVAITDARGRITYVNDKFCAISKYTREELLGKDHRIINSGTHPKPFIRELWHTIGSGRVWKGELRNRAKDGTHYWVATTIVPYLGPEGTPLQYIAIRADITERKEAERALQEAQGELQRHATTLEETVAARTAALRDTIGELEAFSYSISHDMRAPLRAMQSFSKILAEECADEVSPVGKEYIRRINSAAARMDGLIKDVLTYSRVARTDLPLEPVDMGALIRDIVESYPFLQAPDTRVEIVGDFPTVFAIPSVLTQCISNLLGNAVKFVDPGTRPRVRVWAEMRNAEQRVRVYFEDNGFGIDEESHAAIFGIFQRVSKSYEGTGIGLAIVKKGAERMGGSVGLVSAPGTGSTFWLDLRPASP